MFWPVRAVRNDSHNIFSTADSLANLPASLFLQQMPRVSNTLLMSLLACAKSNPERQPSAFALTSHIIIMLP